MTAKNSILLIIKQFPGISYNALLQRLAPQYGSVNSARAALSRALKDMNALGLVVKRDRRFFASDKGELVLHSEMKNKLLFKLHQTLQSKNPIADIDQVVEQLSVLIERAKNDPDLLRAAKNAARFSLSDLHQISDGLSKRREQLTYFSEVLRKQIDAMQELDFTDSTTQSVSITHLAKLAQFTQTQSPAEILVNGPSAVLSDLAQLLGESFRTDSDSLCVPGAKTAPLFSFLVSRFETGLFPNLTLSFSPVLLRISQTQFQLTAPHSKLKDFHATQSSADTPKPNPSF